MVDGVAPIRPSLLVDGCGAVEFELGSVPDSAAGVSL